MTTEADKQTALKITQTAERQAHDLTYKLESLMGVQFPTHTANSLKALLVEGFLREQDAFEEPSSFSVKITEAFEHLSKQEHPTVDLFPGLLSTLQLFAATKPSYIETHGHGKTVNPIVPDFLSPEYLAKVTGFDADHPQLGEAVNPELIYNPEALLKTGPMFEALGVMNIEDHPGGVRDGMKKIFEHLGINEFDSRETKELLRAIRSAGFASVPGSVVARGAKMAGFKVDTFLESLGTQVEWLNNCLGYLLDKHHPAKPEEGVAQVVDAIRASSTPTTTDTRKTDPNFQINFDQFECNEEGVTQLTKAVVESFMAYKQAHHKEKSN